MPAQLVNIQDNQIPLVVYRGQPVLTFALIDQVHGRSEGTARKRFSDNKKRFIEGEDFYAIDSESLSVFRTDYPDIFGDTAQHAILITETGYLMLVKSFTDDLAWQVQRQLVKAYFQAARQQPAYAPPSKVHIPLMPHEITRIKRMVDNVARYFRHHGHGAVAAAIYRPIFQRFNVTAIDQLSMTDLPAVEGILNRMVGEGYAFYMDNHRREEALLNSLAACAGLPVPPAHPGQFNLLEDAA